MSRGPSGTEHLIKRHTRECPRPASLTACACQWRGRYKRKEVGLAKWANCKVDPHTKGKAIEILHRFIKAVDDKTFDPAGERVLGTKQTFRLFIDEWRSRYAEENGLSMDSLGPMLQVIADGRLGDLSLAEVADSSQEIEGWLNASGKARKWSNRTWNKYHELLSRILKRATKWTVGGKPRIAVNPMTLVDRKRRVVQPEHFKQRLLVEDVEQRLFAVVGQLNRTQQRPNRCKLTSEQAEEIRQRLAAGEFGSVLARTFGVSETIVSQIKHGDIWNPEPKVGTKGTEMERRLIAAFDGGLRASEMQRIQLHHVEWRPIVQRHADGSQTEAYRIALPPEVSKGGKTTGQTEYIYAATDRFRHVLEARRFALKNNPSTRTYIFGTEDGCFQAGFRRMWRELFTLAGLDWGRHHGLVWHTIRHEFISRVAENTKDPVLTQELARHKDLETTQGYFHTRRERQLAAAASLERRGKR